MNLWRKWRKQTWNERRLLLEAAWWVALFAAAPGVTAQLDRLLARHRDQAPRVHPHPSRSVIGRTAGRVNACDEHIFERGGDRPNGTHAQSTLGEA